MKRWLRFSPEKLLVVIVLGLFLAQLGRPDNLLYPPGSPYSDLMLTHWPNAHFFRQSVWQDHNWPLWNPDQFSGLPFAANPLSGLWYPPNWLFLILPLTPAFNLLLALHLCLGGLGMMRLVRRLGGGAEGALVASLAWALTPKIWAHLGAGHVGLIYAAGWLPWIASDAVQLARSPFPTTHSPLPIVWALQFLADPRLAAYTAVGVAAAVLWWVAGRWSNLLRKGIHHGDTEKSERKNGKDSVSPWFFILSLLKVIPVGPWLAAGALALALTAVQWLPLLDYLPTTSRPELTVGASAVYSLPPDKLLGLLWASQGGFHEWVTYAGISVLVLALLGWLTIPRRARWGAALGLVLLVLFALGDNGPLYLLVARLPGATLLRVPPRIWFLVGFGLATLAGLGADALVCGGRSLARYRRGLNRLAAAGLGLTGMMAVGFGL